MSAKRNVRTYFFVFFCRHILWQMCFLVFGGHILWRTFVSGDIFCVDIYLYLFYGHKLSSDGHFFLPTYMYLVGNIFLRFFCGHILWQKCLYLGNATGPDSISLLLKIQSCSEFTCVDLQYIVRLIAFSSTNSP